MHSEIDLCSKTPLRQVVLFSIPLIAGNLLQQVYNLADTLIVARYLGSEAVAAVGSCFSLMTFITSILIGLCLGAQNVISLYYGQKNEKKLSETLSCSVLFIGAVSIVLTLLSMAVMKYLQFLLNIPENVWPYFKSYLQIIIAGIPAVYLFNISAAIVRSFGNSSLPLWMIGGSTILNLGLDLYFIAGLHMSIEGAAAATILAQYACGIVLCAISVKRYKKYFAGLFSNFHFAGFRQVFQASVLTCIQQSVMNLGILCVQSLINSFGQTVMTAFALAGKIDSFAYQPLQDFGNAFSIFVSTNLGAGKKERIMKGLKQCLMAMAAISLTVSLMIVCFADSFMLLFMNEGQQEILSAGVLYLQIVGSFYVLIGLLFMFYGWFRAIGKPQISLILTIISLGLRIILAYFLSSIFGSIGIWISIPVGWLIADLSGFVFYKKTKAA